MKLLIFSNNPLSKSNSNGRTMLNMLNSFNSNQIINIYINGSDLALNRGKFYKINEKKLINPFIKKQYISEIREQQNQLGFGKEIKKTSFKCIIRSIVWKNIILYKKLIKIVASEHPDCILIQCGDSDFLIDLSVKISKAFNLPLFAFNSEDYIFKTWNYIDKKHRSTFIYKMFRKSLLKSYDRLYAHINSAIYLTPYLKELYLEKYPAHKSYFIYNSSFLKKIEKYNSNGDIVYSGNIGVGRAETLIQISELIYEIFDKKLTVYSLSKDKKLIEKIKKCKSISFMGGLSYDDNVKILSNAKLIVHCENFNEFYAKDTAHSFSTKIADSLCLLVPFFVFAPASSSTYRYIAENDCGFACSDLDEAKEIFKKIKSNDYYITSKLEKCSLVSSKNHSAIKNSYYFYNIITSNMELDKNHLSVAN